MHEAEIDGRYYRTEFAIPKETWGEVLAALEKRRAIDVSELNTMRRTGAVYFSLESATRYRNGTIILRTQVSVFPDDRGRAFVVIGNPLTGEASFAVVNSQSGLMGTLEARYGWMNGSSDTQRDGG